MIRLYAIGAVALAWALSLVAAYWKGSTNTEREYEVKIAAAQAEADGRAKAAEDRLAQVRADADAQIAKLRASRPSGRAQAKASVDADPTFAAVARPGALATQRLRELEAVCQFTADSCVRDQRNAVP